MSFLPLRHCVRPSGPALLGRWARRPASSEAIPEYHKQALQGILTTPISSVGIRPPPPPPSQTPERPTPLLHDGAAGYRLYAKCNHNNAILSLTNASGDVIAWASGGSCGFKGASKASYEAGYQCSVRIFQKITQIFTDDSSYKSIHILFNGRGRGREALQKALTSTEGTDVRPFVVRITDRTPLKVGGPRAQKARRL